MFAEVDHGKFNTTLSLNAGDGVGAERSIDLIKTNLKEEMTMEMTPNKAKEIIRETIAGLGLQPHKLTARTIDFEDLALASCVFVFVSGWKPDPMWRVLQAMAKMNGFRIESKG